MLKTGIIQNTLIPQLLFSLMSVLGLLVVRASLRLPDLVGPLTDLFLSVHFTTLIKQYGLS